MLLASNQAVKLASKPKALAQIKSSVNPEVTDIMGFADDKEYIESQKNIIYDQNFNNTDKYSMSPEQFESLMQKEKEREVKEKEDKLAQQNLKKLEQEIDNQKYNQLVEMV